MLDPVYALDLWMALRLDSRDFDGYVERNGMAETWSVLLAAVRRSTGYPLCLAPTPEGVCVLAQHRIGPHMARVDVGSSEPLPPMLIHESHDSETPNG